MMEQKLTGELDENTVAKTLRYYSEYIDSETPKRKIRGGSPGGTGKSASDRENDPGYPCKRGHGFFKKTDGTEAEEEKGDKSHSWNKWLFLLILVAVLFLLFTILRALLPVLLPVLLVLFVLSLFKKE